MKSLLLACALALVNFVAAQQMNPSVQIHNSIANLPCSEDTLERKFSLQKINDNQMLMIRTFKSNGCQFVYDQTLESGKYLLTISVSGYEEKAVNFEISAADTNTVILDPIILNEKSNALSEVNVISNQRQYIKVDSDKTTVSVRENAMLSTGSSLDAVKRLPGVITSPTGGITLNGKNVRIYIDGAPSSLTGTDLQNYLLSLPANAIEKVELIYNPGASFDASSSGSVINIITTSKKLKGVNASFNINYNFNKYQKPSPQFLLNGKEKNLSWQTMAGYNYMDSENKSRYDQEFTSFNPVEHLYQKTFDMETNRNAYFRGGLNYRVSKNSNVLFNYNTNISNNRVESNNETFGSGIDFANIGTSKTKGANHEFSLQFKTKLDTLGRTLDITAYSNFFNRKPKFNTTSVENDNFPQSNFSNTDFSLSNYYFKYDFSFPFEKYNFSLNTGGKFNSTEVTNTGNYNIGSLDFNTINFNYSENNLAFYAEARKKSQQI